MRTINIKNPQRILYIGPRDAQYQRRALKTAMSPHENGFNFDLQFDVMHDYDFANVLEVTRAAQKSNRPYTNIVIEENIWNPDEMHLAQTLKSLPNTYQVYLLPTQKESRDSRCQDIEKTSNGVKALRFDNLATRGKMPAKVSDLFGGTIHSPALEQVINKTKERALDHGNEDALGWSDQKTLDSLHTWQAIYNIYPSRFYMVLSEDSSDHMRIEGMVDCFCSEFYAAPHVNGGGTVWSRDIGQLENKIKKALDKGRFYDVVFLTYNEFDKYQEAKKAIEYLSPHTKLVVLTDLPPRDTSEWDKDYIRIAEEKYQGHITEYEQLHDIATFRAKELRESGIPAASAREIFMTKGMIEMDAKRGKQDYQGETMDSILLRWIDYN